MSAKAPYSASFLPLYLLLLPFWLLCLFLVWLFAAISLCNWLISYANCCKCNKMQMAVLHWEKRRLNKLQQRNLRAYIIYIYLFLLHTMSGCPCMCVCVCVCPYAVLYLHKFWLFTLPRVLSLSLCLCCLSLHQLVLFTFKSFCCCCCCRAETHPNKAAQTTVGFIYTKIEKK